MAPFPHTFMKRKLSFIKVIGRLVFPAGNPAKRFFWVHVKKNIEVGTHAPLLKIHSPFQEKKFLEVGTVLPVYLMAPRGAVKAIADDVGTPLKGGHDGFSHVVRARRPKKLKHRKRVCLPRI